MNDVSSSVSSDGESVSDLLEHAVSLAKDAGAVLRAGFGLPHDIAFKGPMDLVTEVDRAAEQLIVERIQDQFPRHGVLGEEGSAIEAHGSPYCWVIDPLDGTTNFAHGLPGFAVSIGLERDGDVVAGVVYDPIREELFAAALGGPATLNGVPIHVSATPTLQASILATGFSSHLPRRAIQAAIWCDILQHVQAVRQLGSAALHLCYVAAGRVDGYWEYGLYPWDVAAGALIVRQAGGAVSSTAGAPFEVRSGDLMASNGLIHEELMALLGQQKDEVAHLESDQ
jgi:myo-inositol-1(or 4)-monophosphatase